MKYRFMLALVGILLLTVLTACGGSGSSNQVNVSLSDFKIQSSQTTFTAGKTYHFVVTNNGQTNHEFMVMQPMSSSQMPMGEMDKMALYHIDQSQLPPGASKSFDFTFPSSQVQKSLEFSCHLPGHYEAGMHLPIVVTS